MEAVEIITFLIIAVVVSGFFVVFVMGLDFKSIQEQFLSSTKNHGEEQDKKNTLKELAYEADKCWSSCSFGDMNVNCGAYYVFDEEYPDANLQAIRSILSKYSLCLDCNLIVSEAKLPTIAKISCLDSNYDHIIISN
jgi:hypothetical protein